MRPTLFADAIPDEIHSERKYWMNAREALRVLKPILPKRCGRCLGEGRSMEATEEFGPETLERCDTCEGRGWLYPDMPDWWAEDWNPPDLMWRRQCTYTWRVLGILEDE